MRGNTQRALVRMLREAGAAEVHVRISSPPVSWPCFYGIDFATRAELIATGLGVEEVRASIGADTLGYISEDGMVEATGQPRERLCTACFTGVYPIELPQRDRLGTNVLELPLEVNGEASGDASAPLPVGEVTGPRRRPGRRRCQHRRRRRGRRRAHPALTTARPQPPPVPAAPPRPTVRAPCKERRTR